MKEQIHEEPQILASAERQMQAWSKKASIEDHLMQTRGNHEPSGSVHPFLAISRETGAGGNAVARLVGRQLGWEVLGKELLDRIAQRYHNDRLKLDLVDETPGNWAFDILGSWMDKHLVSHEAYLLHLTRVVAAAARHAQLVFVGRGVQFMLPRDKGFIVRLIAPLQFRVERVMQMKGVAEAEARHVVEETDRARHDFGCRIFGHDTADPHLYDLVLNTQRFGMENAAEFIVSAMKQFLAKSVSQENIADAHAYGSH